MKYKITIIVESGEQRLTKAQLAQPLENIEVNYMDVDFMLGDMNYGWRWTKTSTSIEELKP